MINAEIIINFVSTWGSIGLVVAIIFLSIGIDRIDEDARDAYVFRILLIPGIILIWPMVLLRWVTLELGREKPHARHQPPREAHLKFWIILSVIIFLVFSSAIIFRSTVPVNFSPVKLTSSTVTQS